MTDRHNTSPSRKPYDTNNTYCPADQVIADQENSLVDPINQAILRRFSELTMELEQKRRNLMNFLN